MSMQPSGALDLTFASRTRGLGVPNVKSAPLAAALLAERLRRRPRLLAEEAGEMRRVGEGEIVGDLVNGLGREDELALGLSEDALADQVTGCHAGRALDVVVEAIGRHRQLLGVEREHALLAEVILDQSAQTLDDRIGRAQRHRTGARATGSETRHLD